MCLEPKAPKLGKNQYLCIALILAMFFSVRQFGKTELEGPAPLFGVPCHERTLRFNRRRAQHRLPTAEPS